MGQRAPFYTGKVIMIVTISRPYCATKKRSVSPTKKWPLKMALTKDPPESTRAKHENQPSLAIQTTRWHRMHASWRINVQKEFGQKQALSSRLSRGCPASEYKYMAKNRTRWCAMTISRNFQSRTFQQRRCCFKLETQKREWCYRQNSLQ